MHTQSQTPQTHLVARTVAILMLCIVVAIAMIACGDIDVSEPEPTTQVQAAPTTAPTATAVPVVEVKTDDEHDSDASSGESSEESKSEEDDNGEHSSVSSSAATEDDDDNKVVSNENQVTGGESFDWSINQALKDAEPLNVIEWTQSPTLSLGAIEASGIVKDGAALFNPVFGEGATFAIYHVNYDDEPMVVILPNLGPMSIWETDLTVAEMNHEFAGNNFTFSANSPLFFDATPSDMRLRVYGLDSDGNHALLAVSEIGFGDEISTSGASASSASSEPAGDGDEDDGEHSSSSASSGEAKDDPAETNGGSADDDTVSNENQISGGYAFDWSENQALVDADPLNVITWESGPTLGLGELYGEATINDDALLFDPMLGEGAALAVYHVNYDSDPMIVLLPSLGPTMIWETDLTVAEMDYEIDGQTLTFRAYSPLFFDGNAADIKLRVYGYDTDNTPSLLAISDINGE